mgnify:CR=1 FL=1
MIICIRTDNVFFSKTYPSFLTVKEGSTSLTKPLSCPKREDVTALRCSEPLRYKVGGPIKGLRQVVRDGTAGGITHKNFQLTIG